MAGRDIVAVGASAGGVMPLRALVGGLSPSYPGSIFVVLHISPREPTSLAEILSRSGPLPATEVTGPEPVRPGHVYVAGPNRHLVVEPGTVRLLMGPKENLHRPSVDVLFRSAAVSYGDRTVGVVLSGALDDGTAGLGAIRTGGGLTVAQDPQEAAHASMPKSAIDSGVVDKVLPVCDVPPLLERLAREDVAYSGTETGPHAAGSGNGTSVPLSCPSCNGPLRRTREGGVDRFRCRIGHAFTLDSLAQEHEENLERALWTALRILEERVVVQRRLAETARGRTLDALAAVHEKKARHAEREVAVLREVVESDLGAERDPD